MLKDFFSNATILIASFAVMGQIFKNMPLSPSSSHSTKLYWGICYGVLGNILMAFSFQINSTTIADLRHLSIVVAAAFGGVVPAIIASVFIALGRVTLFGFTETAIVAAISVLLTGIVCGWFSKLNLHPTLKAFTMNLIGLFFITIVFAIYIEDTKTLLNVLLNHYLISLVGGFFAYHLSVYIANSNAAEKELNLSLLKLQESEQKLHKANELLNQLSYMDGLTGIGNRRHFDEVLNKEWTRLTSTQSPLTLLMFDIDYFKKYNDTYGHLAGDQCLQTISSAIKDLVANNPYAAFSRYGGEEFALILTKTNLDKAVNMAKLIQKKVHSLKIDHRSSEVSDIVTISIGIASIIPSSEAEPKDLIHLADTSLYTSKANGRNTISTL
ncbi:diguanylate cyclase [Bacillus sp. EB106-08-02-XG196]|uniref:GGDEF domain-containing protein n=1 Tax=Bacillus sp. EB106-08-02-XG196 TaxID=2737049 RepID=UPI0015C4BF11|nr:GGDEF domain-containing protein [Bacillus sp. EB106-08-02-XG196]NWQ44096.1 diguanylate cyclase [Bacillus sp. EB106-08-02-XG196]